MYDLEKPQHFTKEQSKWIKAYVILKRKEERAETVDKCSELFAETLSNITNICGTNCPIKCNWGTEESCKEMCKKWFEEKLKEQNKCT